MMKRAIKNKSTLYSYLSSIKVLETGSEEAIALARKTYWKIYKATWAKNQRRHTKQFVIALNANEARQVSEAARAHKRSVTRFIKQSCFSYMTKRYLPVDPLALATIRQLLAVNYNTLHKLFEECKVPYEIGRELLAHMKELEQKVTYELYNPKEQKQNET
jgi:hypothetical protein